VTAINYVFIPSVRNGKVVLVHAMKTYWGAYSFLTSALAEGEWSTSRPDRFKLGEIVPSVSIE
jgi:hypothetical protein